MAERPADPVSRWSSGAHAVVVPEGIDGRNVVRIAVPAALPASGDAVQKDVMGQAIALTAGRYDVSRPLDLTDLRGWRVELAVRMRYIGVPVPPVPWEGVLMKCEYATPTGVYSAGLNGLWGDRDWYEAKARIRIPANGTAASLKLGLIATSGTLWVDEVRITKVEPPLAEQIRPGWVPPRATRRGTGMGGVHEGAIARLSREWGANIVKVWVALPQPDLAPEAYAQELEAVIEKFAGQLAEVEAVPGMVVIPQISAEKGWTDPKLGGTHRMYLDPAIAELFIDSWRRIAKRFVGRPAVWGYDLLNETVLRVPAATGCPDWEGLAERTAREINAIDPQARIIVQPEQWWGNRAFEMLRPIAAQNVVYSIHMYAPFELTHQGVGARTSEGITYPGVINGVQWDKERLRESMQPAREFQLAHRVPMQVGEFSCIRWAPDGSAGRWLADVTKLFEEYGWDFTYHGAYDWDGWSVELGGDPADQQSLPEPGTAKQALLKAMMLNRVGTK